MSTKIVFNGREYDGVESMPADVRQEYERVLGALGAEDRGKVEAALGHGAGLKLNVTVHRTFRVGGKEYESVDAMPADARAAFEKAVEKNPALRDTAASIPKASLAPGAMPVMPPAIDADDSRRGTLLRVALWVVVGLVVLVWLLSRR
jgi:hypothetical protein